MNKNKKIILGLICIIVMVSVLDIIIITIKHHNNEQNANTTNQDINKENMKISCHKEITDYFSPELNMTYNIKEKYSFYVAQDKKMISDKYLTIVLFDNIDDLNKYYDYLTNVLKVNYKVEKDESDLSISTWLNNIQGGFEYYSETYKNLLITYQYECTEENVESISNGSE